MKYSVLVLDDDASQAQKIVEWIESARDVDPVLFESVDRVEVATSAYAVWEDISAWLERKKPLFNYRVIIADVCMPDPAAPAAAAGPEHGGLMLYERLREERNKQVGSGPEALKSFPKLVITSNRPSDIKYRAKELFDDQKRTAAHQGRWAFYLPKTRLLSLPEGDKGLLSHPTWINAVIHAIREANQDAWFDSFFQGTLAEIAGVSAAWVGVKLKIMELAHERIVCIAGESGSGKEMVAAALHEVSGGKIGGLKTFNLRGYYGNTNLGYFINGTDRGYLGPNDQAHSGWLDETKDAGQTLFLDEAGADVLDEVEKLLRVVIETGKYSRLKGGETRHQGKIILASSEMENYLRDRAPIDFVSRVGHRKIKIPSLRECRDDIPIFAKLFFSKRTDALAESGKRRKDSKAVLSEDLVDHLKILDWPGNMRQLKNCMEFMAERTYTSVVTTKDWDESEVYQPVSHTFSVNRVSADRGPDSEKWAKALEESDGNYTAAGKLLGASASKASRVIANLGLQDNYPPKPGRRPKK